MRKLVQGFASQLGEAIQIGQSATLSSTDGEIRQVLISGLGGSGIGGTIVSQLVQDSATVPIIANKDYFIPGFVNEHTLVIISSYSGNTEETLQAFDTALKQGAKIACITSGGKVLELAQQYDLPHIVIPGGLPPRAAFAYSFTQQFFLLAHFGIIPQVPLEELQKGLSLIQNEGNSIHNEAEKIADQLLNKIPVIYADASWEGVAVRLRQQINENSKMLCWHHVYPEMNHNELVGWTTKNEDLAILFLRDHADFNRTQKRMEITKEIYSNYTSTQLEVWAKGSSVIEKAIYLIHFGDWVSVHLAEKKGIDPVEVDVITGLKDQLANF